LSLNAFLQAYAELMTTLSLPQSSRDGGRIVGVELRSPNGDDCKRARIEEALTIGDRHRCIAARHLLTLRDEQRAGATRAGQIEREG
jgi:hypothetical protein